MALGMGKGIAQIFIALICILLSCYGFLWFISSASLASGYCSDGFSLFHPELRCQQPYLATILSAIAGVGFCIFLWLGIKNIKGSKNAT